VHDIWCRPGPGRPGQIQVLLYKAASPRPKDEADFAAALPVLRPSQRQWLRESLALACGRQHPRHRRLSAAA